MVYGHTNFSQLCIRDDFGDNFIGPGAQKELKIMNRMTIIHSGAYSHIRQELCLPIFAGFVFSSTKFKKTRSSELIQRSLA